MNAGGPSSRALRLAPAVCLALAWGPPAAAQPPAQPPAPAPIVLPPRVGVSGAPAPISIADAIRMTLERNNDVSIARIAAQAAREEIRAAEGAYDPVLMPTLSYENAASPNASAIGGARNGRLDQDVVNGGITVEGLAPWSGGRFAVDFTSSRIETSNQFARLNPQFLSSLNARYVQPLFRGRRIDQERREIELARRATDLSDAQLTQVLMDQLTLVEQAYWDLVFAVRNLEVQTTALAQAQSQVASNERQVQQGTLAPIDVVEAATQAANFRQAVASAQQDLTAAENRLKALILQDRSDPLWDQPLAPAQLADREMPALSLEEALRLALERRPELAVLESRLAQTEVDLRFFEDQTRPQVDLAAGYSLSGLAGGVLRDVAEPPVGGGGDDALLARLNELSILAGLPPLEEGPGSGGGNGVPDLLVGSYGRSLRQLVDRRFPSAVVQLQMELPLGNRTARANAARTRLTRDQIRRQRQQLEQAIEAEVRNVLQAVHSSRERLDAASSARRNAQEQYDSERRRFESGISTVFLVLERQTALVAAQADELRARADLNQAIAQLDRATGRTLEHHGVALKVRN